MTQRRLAVLGSPIGHSKSPALHRAAYGVLGLDWSYEAIDVPEGGLAAFLETLDDSWRGLSLTMPLKREAMGLLDEASHMAERVEAANTILFDRGRVIGDNTDVGGIRAALRERGIEHVQRVHILGAGATAGSAIAAAGELGAREVLISARRPEAVVGLSGIAAAFGVPAMTARGFGDPLDFSADLLIDTLPGGVDPEDVAGVDDAGALLAVAYDPWPSARAARWLDRGGLVIDGLDMLLQQALRQVRKFVVKDRHAVLPGEEDVVRAMRAAVERS